MSATPVVSLVVAAAANDVIGVDNRLPWHLPEDLRRFRDITMGKPIVMGRRTHESIGRALPGRRNIVLSRRPGFSAEGCEAADGLDAALALAQDADEVMVIGGAALYREALPLARRIYLTRLHRPFEGDSRFPSLDNADWRAAERQDFPGGEERELGYSYLTLERKAAPPAAR
ncbi:dihydrofolate reductase [Lentisalinibacter sediminis]|uniref:dihydrofolate reductase n=1 Tax=Lentisalinibacter sediminis TaxID=2992237 RepID=UPI0038660B86